MQKNTNFTSLLILLVGVLLMVLNQYILGGRIPSWVFIAILVLWLVIKIRDLRNMRKKD
jgi:predicted ferric reductase